MSSSSDQPRPPGDEPASNGRLDSWKEIAAYLRRSVRTAKRWEKEQQLPVHRHHHDKRDSVYAYGTELDAWWNNRGAKLIDQDGAEDAVSSPDSETLDVESGVEEPEREDEVAPSPSHTSRRAALIGVGFALVTVLGGFVVWLFRYGSGTSAGSRRPLPFKARDWVLVTSFENRTGQPLLDGTLECALQRELSISRYVNVVPRERIGDTLRLMRKPLDTRVDAGVGREICFRDGDIRSLITGRIEKLGSKYLLSVEMVDPNQGASIASVAENAANEEQLLPATRRISDEVRAMLGENPPSIQEGRAKLLKVTTPSLRALQLYSRADALIAQGNSAAAEELLKQAVAEDPEFASAYIHLAHAINNQRRPVEEFRPHAETALRLSETTTERERYFIRGSYYDLLGQREKAIAAYEALLTLYPDHYWGAGNLAALYRDHGLANEAVRIGVRLAELRPKDFEVNFEVALDLVRMKQDPARARPYARRARELISPEIVKTSPFGVAWVELFPAFEYWLSGDTREALAEAERFAQKLDSTPLGEQEMAVLSLGGFFQTLGKLETAEKLQQRVSTPFFRFAALAMVSYFRGDRAGLEEHLRAALASREPMDTLIGVLLARTGSLSEAERLISKQENARTYSGGCIEVERAELAFARGQTAEAVRQLKAGRERAPFNSSNTFFLGTETLATALSQQGDMEGAVRVLELASQQRTRAIFHFVSAGHSWMRTQLLLAKLYRRVGRQEDARRIAGELLKLLVYADPDHVLLRELKRVHAETGQYKNAFFIPGH